MAITMSNDAQKKFFHEMFGQEWVQEWIDPLIQAGAKLNVNFIGIQLAYQGQNKEVKLALSTSTLMKGNGNPLLVANAKASIDAFIKAMNYDVVLTKKKPDIAPVLGGAGPQYPSHEWQIHGGGNGAHIAPASGVGGGSTGNASSSGSFTGHMAATGPNIQQIPKQGGLLQQAGHTMDELLTYMEFVPAEMLQKAKPFLTTPQYAAIVAKNKAHAQKGMAHPTAPIPVVKEAMSPDPIPLRDAKVVGQKVKGTDAMSVYRAIAISPRVKLAARITGSAISIRAEFATQPMAQEIAALKAIGMSEKGGGKYLSMHISAGDVPPGRVLGAFLLDLGVEFQDQIKSIKEMEA